MTIFEIIKYQGGKKHSITPAIAGLTGPFEIGSDISGNIYISDKTSCSIYKMNPRGKASLLAGLPDSEGYVNGTGVQARFKAPKGIACDKSGNVYVADSGNEKIRKITPNGKVTTVADLGMTVDTVNVANNGDIVAVATDGGKVFHIKPGGRIVATYDFEEPTGAAFNPSGRIFVADKDDNRIKIVYTDGSIKEFCGSDEPEVSSESDSSPDSEFIGKVQDADIFEDLGKLVLDNSGIIYVLDDGKVKKINRKGDVFILYKQDADFDGVTVTPSGVVYATFTEEISEESSDSSESSDNSNSSGSSDSSDNSNSSGSSDSSLLA